MILIILYEFTTAWRKIDEMKNYRQTQPARDTNNCKFFKQTRLDRNPCTTADKDVNMYDV